MPERPDVSVVIVTWNSGEEIYDCLLAANKSLNGLHGEFIVTDNSSGDNTQEQIAEAVDSGIHGIQLVLNNSNKGYAEACNQGILMSKGRHVLLLNPDAEVIDDCIVKLVNTLEADSTIGAVAPQLLNPDGSIQYSCRTFPEYRDMFFELMLLPALFPSSRFFSRWKMKYFAHNSKATVDQPMAAALLVRGELLRQLKGFDAQFRMFFNDVDLCRRIYNEGCKIIFTPEAKSYHKLGASVRKNKPAMIDAWNDDCKRYFAKCFNKPVTGSLLSAGLTVSGAVRKLFHRTGK